jgi:peptide/nickel transport system substrate-binding protein
VAYGWAFPQKINGRNPSKFLTFGCLRRDPGAHYRDGVTPLIIFRNREFDMHGVSNPNLNYRTTRRETLRLMSASAAGLMLPAMIGHNPAFAAGEDATGQLTLAFSQEPTVFNPFMPHIEVDEGIHFAVFDTLFTFDPEGVLYPVLVTEVPSVANGGISADGMRWKIKLKEGVKWHDGRPFSAEDVKFSLELPMDPNFRSYRTTGFRLMKDITVVSPTELTWTMTAPFAPLAAVLGSTWIVPKHAFEGLTDRNIAPFNNAPIGTGPFVWKERMAGDHITLEANPDYHLDGPYINTLIVKYIPDLNVMYTQFKSGDIDVMGLQWITADHYEEAKTLPGKTVQVAGAGSFESFALNMQRPQFQELAVRQALYAAIDKKSIIEALYYGIPPETETYMPRQSFYYNPDLPKHEFNLHSANKLLDDAGWVRGADGIREKGGVKLSFTNSTTAGNHLREQVQQFIQQTFKDIGVAMTISNLPPAVMWGDYWMKSQFDSVIVGMNTLLGADPDNSDYFMSGNSAALGGAGQNTTCYQNAEVDALFKQGAETFVPEERKPIYQKIQELIRHDLPLLPLYQYAVVKARKENVTGPLPNVNYRIDTWNVNTWKI